MIKGNQCIWFYTMITGESEQASHADEAKYTAGSSAVTRFPLW